MSMKKSALRRGLATLCLAACFFAAAHAQAELETAKAAPPEAFSSEVRALLAHQSYSVTLDGAELGRFWLRAEIPAGDSAAPVFGVQFSELKPGQLIGVAELSRPWSDYKNTTVEPGAFTLRYALQPADGNHTGASSYRDFLLLLPAAHDPDPTRDFSTDELNRLSGEASGAIHPAVMALFPIWDEVEGAAVVKNELDQWTLAVKLGNKTYGLVIEGHGEIEGY